MANSYELIRYKQQLMSMFINNELLVELIDNTDIETAEDLINNNIFNYVRVPQTPEEAKTFICMKIDVPEVYSRNFLFKKLTITIYVITHEDLMHTKYGATRIDLMGAEVDKLLNGYSGIGKAELELISNVENTVGTKHRCRILTFKASDINNGLCGD